MKIKTLFRTLLAVMVAVIMSLSLVVFAACDPDGNGPDNSDKPGNQNTDNDPPAEIPAEKVDNILATDYAAIELSGTLGVKALEEGTSYVSGKINLDGSADITFRQEEEEEENYAYIFMREGAVYGLFCDDEVAADKFAEVPADKFKGLVDLEATIEGILGMAGDYVELPEGLELGDLVKGGVDGLNGALLKLANASRAASDKDGVITVDINKAIYNVVADVKGLVSGLKGTTTVGDILGNAALKNYSQLVTELVTPQDLVDAVAAILESFGGEADAPAATDEEYPEYPDESEIAMAYAVMALNILNDVFKAVEPDENSTTYDYLVKVISSQELVDEINAAFKGMGAPSDVLPKKVSEFTLNDILLMAEVDMSVSDIVTAATALIESYTSGVTETSFGVTVEEVTPFVLSNAKILYTYGDSGLTSQKIEADVVVNIYAPDGTKEGETSLDIDLTFDYKATAYAATDFVTLPDLSGVEFGGIVNPPIELSTTLYEGENHVVVPAGETLDFYVSVSYEWEEINIVALNKNLLLSDRYQQSGYDITIENLSQEDYENGYVLTIKVTNNSNEDMKDIIKVSEAAGEGRIKLGILPAETEGDIAVEGTQWRVVAGKTTFDEGESEYFYVEVEETGTYFVAIVVTEGKLPYVEVSDVNEETVECETSEVTASGAAYVFELDAGLYYITVWNSDENFDPVSGTGYIVVCGISPEAMQ